MAAAGRECVSQERSNDDTSAYTTATRPFGRVITEMREAVAPESRLCVRQTCPHVTVDWSLTPNVWSLTLNFALCLEHFARGAERFNRRRHTGVDRRLQEHFLDLVLRHAVVERALDVQPQ